MTAQTTLSPLPESATTDHTHPIPQPDTKPGRTRRRRNDHGFSMLELLVGMVILGILGAIGYGIYTNFIGDARDTALDQNIQTAAAELQSVLALEPTLAADADALVTAMTNRTNFVWDGTLWDLTATAEPDTIRFQFIEKATSTQPTVVLASGAAPLVSWVQDNGSAVRIHLANPEGEWRCALLILKPSTTVIGTISSLVAPADAAKTAQMRGIWYDGGSTLTDAGIHDCSPVGYSSGYNCAQAATPAASDKCLPEDAQTWNIADADARIDDTAVAATAALPATASLASGNGIRSLHRSTAALDSNA